jgi:hypothetical protein
VPFEKRITHPGQGKYPSITFDHILLKYGPKLTASLIDGKGISDHNPVMLALMPSGGTVPIAFRAATQSSTPIEQGEVPTTPEENLKTGLPIKYDPHMVGYSEIPGMPQTTPAPTPLSGDGQPASFTQ